MNNRHFARIFTISFLLNVSANATEYKNYKPTSLKDVFSDSGLSFGSRLGTFLINSSPKSKFEGRKIKFLAQADTCSLPTSMSWPGSASNFAIPLSFQPIYSFSRSKIEGEYQSPPVYRGKFSVITDYNYGVWQKSAKKFSVYQCNKDAIKAGFFSKKLFLVYGSLIRGRISKNDGRSIELNHVLIDDLIYIRHVGFGEQLADSMVQSIPDMVSQ